MGGEKNGGGRREGKEGGRERKGRGDRGGGGRREGRKGERLGGKEEEENRVHFFTSSSCIP